MGPEPKDVQNFEPLSLAKSSIEAIEAAPDLDREDRLVRYRSVLAASFASHIDPPTDPDDRDEYDLVKRKLERRISAIAGNPNTISAVAERYYDFSGITEQVRYKYRRIIKSLTDHLGDIPLNHVTAAKLRGFRDSRSASPRCRYRSYQR